MAMNSSFNDWKQIACGIAIAPIKTAVQGPAPRVDDPSKDDIIDEAIKFFRVNLFFKNYTYKGNILSNFKYYIGPADILLIYLYTFITYCLQ